MDISDITPEIEDLGENLDKLEEVLKPLMEDLGTLSSKAPLLNKAKLNVLTAFAIESLLFSSLQLNGVDAKNHEVYSELTRVKQYFEKIKNIGNPPPKPEKSLDTEAAIRFVRSDLADNKDVKEKLTEQIAKERAKAASKAAEAQKKRTADEAAGPGAAAQSSEKPAKRSKKNKNKKK